MNPRRYLDTAQAFVKAVGEAVCALADSALHRGCVRHETTLDDGLEDRTYPEYPLEAACAELLRENTRLDKDNDLLTSRVGMLEAVVIRQQAEIAALRVLAAAPIATSEGEQGK